MKPKLPTAPKTLAILRWMQTDNPITVAFALQRLGVYALSQEIGRLKKLGWKIDSEFIKTSGGAHVKRYRLA